MKNTPALTALTLVNLGILILALSHHSGLSKPAVLSK